MDDLAKELIRQGNSLFEVRHPIDSLWQTISENFYPIRADFTRQRNMGEEFASDLLSSYPIIAHRELMSVMSSMLRRDDWFQVDTFGGNHKTAGLRWMKFATDSMRDQMYARGAGFVRSTKEGDGDFTAFGNAVLSIELNKYRDGLLYRAWHPRDVAWTENEARETDGVYRKWKPRAIDLIKLFPETVHSKVKELAEKSPNERVSCYHSVVPVEQLGNEKEWGRMKWASVFIDRDNDHHMEKQGKNNKHYCIPRWQTISGSQYAYSPATVAALPDARLLQAMTNTLLEAGEKFTNPPMLAVQGAVRDDLQIYAGGVTWVDEEYDERLGEVVRPLTQDRGGMPIGFNMQEDIRNQLSEAFYLNKLTLPDARQMTAYEVSERMNEFVRQTLPLFEPMEDEYNGQLLEITFDLMMDSGMLGSPMDIPRELRDEEVKFSFETPIKESIEKKKGVTFQQTSEMLAAAMEIDPSARHEVDLPGAFRDAMIGVGVDPTWLNDEEAAEAGRAQDEAMQMAQMAAGAAA